MLVSGPHCLNCTNAPYGVSRLEADGSGSSGIMLLGDSPWHFEQAIGKPFSGPSGQLLNRILERLGIKRESLILTNTMACSPPTLGWTDNYRKIPAARAAIDKCEPYLMETIRKQRPKVIVALGAVAMKRMIGLDVEADITSRHSYVHESLYGIPAIPTFHPSYLLQGKHKLEICVMYALRRAQEVANGSYVESRFNLLLDPPIEEARDYLRRYLDLHSGRISLLMVDIETPESADLDEEELEEKGTSYHIDRAGFSLDESSGISFPFREPYIELLQEAINASDTMSEWADNHFDSKRLRAAGISIPGRVISGMWAWHFYQSDLLKGLGFVAPFFYAGPPFKHLASSQPALYNALDNAVGRACTVGSMDKLKAEGRLDRFMRHCVEADKIYVKMGGMGVKIDVGRFSGFRARLKMEYKEQVNNLQPLVPDSVKPVHLWKRKPDDMDGVEEIPLPDPSNIIDGKLAKQMIAAAKGVVSDSQFKAAKKKILELKSPYRYKRIEEFNPGSPLQIKALIKSLGLKIPVNRDGETTDAKHLKRFSKYPIFHQILIAKQRKTIISNYNWQVDDRGRIKTTYGYHPSTLRKSSRNYNLQVIPKRSDLAAEFRRSIVAAEGCYFVTSDASAIEAVLVGYDAGSDSYIRLAKAGLHGWMTAAYHNRPIPLDLPFEQLTKLCKAAKKEWPKDYEILKRVGHL